MVVAQLIDSMHIGGAEVLAVNIANSLADKGVISHMIVTREEGKLNNAISNNVNYFFLSRKSTLDIKSVLSLRRYIIDNKINIVHAHSSSYFIASLVKLTYSNFKLIWHDHYGNSNFLHKRKEFPINICSRLFYKVVCVNKDLQNWSIQKLALNSNKINLLNNFPLFNNTTKTTILKGVDDKRIVCLAALRPQKDHLNLLKAFKEITKNYKDWSLHLIGKIHNDSYSNNIKEFIKKNKLSKNVFLYDACLDIRYILEQSTIGVLSSKSEGLPIALLEYGSFGLPVLVTDVGDCSKVVNIKQAIVKANNSLLFAEKLKEIIESKTLQKSIAISLQKEVKKNYSKDSFIKKIINIYN